MATLESIIQINISRQTSSVSRAAFNIPMFLSAHTAFSERAREYTSLTEVAGDFSVTSNTYLAAQKLFGQEVKPPKIVVGKRQVNEVTVGVGTLSNSTAYTITVNGEDYSFTSDSSATALEIVDGLEAAYNLDPISGIVFTDLSNGTFTIEVSTPGTAWSLAVSSNLTTTNTTPSETWVAALEAVQVENDVWYAFDCESHVEADILALAASAEGKKKIYLASTASAATKTASTSDIASQLEALAYDRTALIYSAAADTQFPECAWVGGQLPYTPGSNTWAFKRLAGVTVDTFTTTETTNLEGKKCNYYQEVGGQNITLNGVMASGEYIDVIVGADWLEARMRERIYFRLVNLLKIPYTQAGLTIIEAEMRAVLAEGVANGFLAADPAPTVTMPNVRSIEPNLKALRTVEGITFQATLAGAVHKVVIQGTLTLD